MSESRKRRPRRENPDRRALICKIANSERHHPGIDTSELRRELAELQIADHIKAVVAKAPPLRPEQRERLAALLRGPSAHGEAA